MILFRSTTPLKVELIGLDTQAQTIFNWIEDSSLPVSKLIMALKGGSHLHGAGYWGAQLALNWSGQTTSGSKNWIVVPAPRALRGKRDHGYWLARAVADTLNLPLVDCLERVDTLTQKQVNKSQRLLANVVCHEKISQDMAVLFVDDVITTGATAALSYHALSQPENFEILALARRCALRGGPANDISPRIHRENS